MSHRLNPGERLVHGQSLRSNNGRYVLEMQDDGNLVLYAPGHIATWASGTDGERECVAVMQDDGNLVVIAAGNRPVWASGTDGERECVLFVQDDGNLVIRAAGNRPVWATATELRNMRLEITDNGRPSASGGQRFNNETNQSINISAGSLAIDVPPNGEGGIEQINHSQPASVDVRATSGGHSILVGQIAILDGYAIPGGHHRAFTPDGDIEVVPD